MRRHCTRIGDFVAEQIIKEGGWSGKRVLTPLYEITSITLANAGIEVDRTYKLNEVEREAIYGAQYDDVLMAHAIKDSDYHLGDLPYSVNGWDEKPLGT